MDLHYRRYLSLRLTDKLCENVQNRPPQGDVSLIGLLNEKRTVRPRLRVGGAVSCKPRHEACQDHSMSTKLVNVRAKASRTFSFRISLPSVLSSFRKSLFFSQAYGACQDTGLRLKHSFDTTTSIKRISFPPLGDSGFCATSAGVVVSEVWQVYKFTPYNPTH